MFNRTPRAKTELEKALDRALTQLDNSQVDSKEYGEILDRVAKLHKMKEDEKPKSVSKDTMAMIAANLFGIVLIISTEREHVITTKAMQMLARPKDN